MRRRLPLALTLLLSVASEGAIDSQETIGVFESHGDVGLVLHAGAVKYDTSAHTYTVSGSGENMWFDKDAFQLVWKKVSGDVSLTADIAFEGEGRNPHRKAVLMVRQSLDADSVYADVALHGDGLTSLQFRDEEGAATHEVQASRAAPIRLRISKDGDFVHMFLAGPGEDVQFAAGSMRLRLRAPYYVGIGVCSHEKDLVETAVFSHVELAAALPAPSPTLYSTIETVPIASGDRRVAYVTAGRVESPHWTPDGGALLFNAEGRTQRLSLSGGGPETVDTSLAAANGLDAGPEITPDGRYVYFNAARGGTMQIWRKRPDGGEPTQITSDDFNNWFPHVSPDGKRVVFLSYEKDVTGHPENKDVMLRLLPLESEAKIQVLAKLFGGQGTIDVSSWSPDSQRLAFVSYHLVH